MRFLIRAVPTVCAVLVAAASFALSYVALRDVAARTAAVPEHLAWLTPICVDGAVLAGSASLWASSMRRTKKDPVAVLTVVSLLVISVVINVSHAGPSPLAKIIAALPPLTLLACLELVAGQYRREADAEAEQAHSAPGQVSTATAPLPVTASGRADVVGHVEHPAAAVVVEPEEPAVPAPAPQTPADVLELPGQPGPAVTPGTVTPQAVTPQALTPQALTSEAVSVPAAAPAPSPLVPQSAPVISPTTLARPEPADAAAAAPSRPAAAPKKAQVTQAADAVRPSVVPAAKPAPQATTSRPADASTADRVRELFVAHLAAGGAATDPSLARAFSSELGVSAAHIRRILGPLRLELDNAA